jgi:phytoene dehydrogenase-like protein
LHDRVIDDLGLRSRGLRIVMGDPTYFVPFGDGHALTVWNDDEETHRSIRSFAPDQVQGWVDRNALFDRIRDAVRPMGDDDLWLDPDPTRAEIERRLAGDEVALATVFTDSQVDNLRRFYSDDRMIAAYCGQGVIGTNASPFDPGTAFVDFHHASGRQEGMNGEWGFVMGGMGAVSAALAEAAEEAGATIATDCEVTRITPGYGIELANGDTVEAGVVVANADPVRTAAMIGDPGFTARVARIPIASATVKVTYALSGLPDLGVAHATDAQVEVVRTAEAMHESYLAARAGGISDEIWCELYFQTPYDPSVAPPGAHTMSVFAQFVPYDLAVGTWEERRDEIADATLAAIARFAPDVADCVVDRQVLGPPDVEERMGLTGGHIFQGECLPDQMWEQRFAPRFGVEGVYLCGAGTHPGGSVMAINGRNAAMAVLADLEI